VRPGIPGGLSFLVHRDFSDPLPGLNDFPEEDQPPVTAPFVSCHLMAGVGTLRTDLSLLGLLLLWRGTLFTHRELMGVFVVRRSHRSTSQTLDAQLAELRPAEASIWR
jgi:cytochrome d ubiquinol oxidase subunit I